MSEKFQSTHIRLTEKQYDRLRRESFETGKSQSEITREALELRWKEKEEKKMLDEKKKIYEAIVAATKEVTDFPAEYDHLFSFMAEHPDSATTQNFIEHHIVEKNAPVTSDGEPCFTYLIGERFALSDWVAEEDVSKFLDYFQDVEVVAQEGDISWYVAKVGDQWVAWDDASPAHGYEIFNTREEAIRFQRDGFEAAGLPEKCWLLDE